MLAYRWLNEVRHSQRLLKARFRAAKTKANLFYGGTVLLVASCTTTAAPKLPERTPAVAVNSPAAPVVSQITTPALELPPVPAQSNRWQARLQRFYAAQADIVQRHAAYTELFAPRLTQFISLRNVSRQRAIAAADAFFAEKTNVMYALEGEVTQVTNGAGTHVEAVLSAHYESDMPPAWVQQVPELADQIILTQTGLKVAIEADAQGAVTAYQESKALPPRLLRVTTATQGYAVPYVQQCWQPAKDVESFDLAKGVLVEPTSDSIIVNGCGPTTSILQVRYQRRLLWVLLALYQLVPNPLGGSSLGGTDFLEDATVDTQ
ncbi:MAG TPA: hypothetical protein VIV60_31265 [Polyangiaceae bacterium]